jgi:hypothetical protein
MLVRRCRPHLQSKEKAGTQALGLFSVYCSVSWDASTERIKGNQKRFLTPFSSSYSVHLPIFVTVGQCYYFYTRMFTRLRDMKLLSDNGQCPFWNTEFGVSGVLQRHLENLAEGLFGFRFERPRVIRQG